MMKNRRIGKFLIDFDLIDNLDPMLTRIMGQCVIIEAIANYQRHCIDYTAISRHFEAIPPSTIAPEYLIHIGENDVQFVAKNK